MFLYLLGFASCAQYAFLYAGSSYFYNYRHQADIFTIYNQLLARGFTTSNIALYAYDDIATDFDNPFKGQVFHTVDHKTNVYPGSDAINVKKQGVTDQAFYDAITNLPTTNNDYVFIYYDNHGGPGILGTPNGYEINADKLAEAFNTASSSNLYKQCLFLIEACYSGSVAEVFTAPNLATITAANNQESSYAAVYDSEIGTYLSNEFTNYFIAIIDENPSISVGELYETLKKETQQSHVCYYGDESIQSVALSTFIGTPTKFLSHKVDKSNLNLVKPHEATIKSLQFFSEHEKAYIRSRARLQLLRLKTQSKKLQIMLDLLVKYVDPKNYEKIMNDTESKITPTYFEVLRVFSKKFGEMNPDDYGRLNVLKALAATHSKAEIIQGIFAVIL
ncbi:hypothetical protein M9Y10_033150 [Tritrichomonas musculus]|uniref:Clan CD, family C13, asparaginyl endopeptidase-like cysteine peptidase n=1 Tax=Tritrichomonas musculus TaxID=1915356 RepID=A0ABR2GX70_9EUKA